MSFTVAGFVLLGLSKFIAQIEAPLMELNVARPYIEIASEFVGSAYDTVAAVGLAILGISSLPPREVEKA
jgi:hypothetical protein